MDEFGETYFGKGKTLDQYIANIMNCGYVSGLMNGLFIADGLNRIANGHYIEGLLEIGAYTAVSVKVNNYCKQDICDDIKKFQIIDSEVKSCFAAIMKR